MISVYNFHLKVIYSFFKLFPIRNKVTFLSRQSNNASLDFCMLINEMIKQNKKVEIKVLCKQMGNGLLEKIKYNFYMYSQMYHIATSKVCIVDTYIPVISILNHKKELKVIQIWHALGAIKKFGFQSVGTVSGRNENIAKKMKMHKNYDYIISTSNETTKYFKEAFNYSEDKFLNYGLPRIDYLIKNEKILKKRILSSYPKLANKKIILYAPTFRTTKETGTNELIKNIDLNKYNVIVKEHFLQPLSVDNDVFTCPEYSALELLTVCDYLITDYSAISIEGLVLNKKTYFYVFDYDSYMANNGLNVDLLKKMPNLTIKNVKKLIETMQKKKYDYKALAWFKNLYLEDKKGNSTELIVNFVMEHIK